VPLRNRLLFSSHSDQVNFHFESRCYESPNFNDYLSAGSCDAALGFVHCGV